jgi:predicted metal-dependent phosphoesterase TrpH
MIDLHLHTTASDGTCSPEQLVGLAVAAGLKTIGITDHDTMASVGPVMEAAAPHGLTVIPGIEITSVHAGRDVHVLGYDVNPDSEELRDLLDHHRRLRMNRAREIARRLADAGAPIDVDALIAEAPPSGGKALARPTIARALVAAGHVQTVAEAFDRFLGDTCSAYVPHRGASPSQVVGVIGRAGGLSSLAHPGTLGRDELIPSLCEAGLDAIEAHHSAHTPEQRDHYLELAQRRGLAVTGGSDFHGPGTRRSEWFGKITLPDAAFRDFIERLQSRARMTTALTQHR